MKDTIVARIRGLKESNPELFKDKVDFLLVEEEERVVAGRLRVEHVAWTERQL